MVKPRPPRVMRVVLTRELIVHTAVELVERDGPRALSMRAVGAALGVTAMAMYRHVPSKEALIEGMADYVMAALDDPPEEAGHWKDGARALVHSFRSVADEYPRSLALVLETDTTIPVGMRAIERALELCREAGLDGPSSVRVTRILIAYILGSQLRDAGMARLLARQDGDPAGKVRELSAGRFPLVEALPAELMTQRSGGDFDFGLELLLSSIELLGAR